MNVACSIIFILPPRGIMDPRYCRWENLGAYSIPRLEKTLSSQSAIVVDRARNDED